MSTPAHEVEVVELPDQHRFVVRHDDTEAELVYRKNGGRLSILHTEVPAQLGGQGIGGILVEAAVTLAEAEDLTVVPWCPFAQRYLEHHPETAARVDVRWPRAAVGPPEPPVEGADVSLDEQERESFPASDPHSDWAGPDTAPGDKAEKRET